MLLRFKWADFTLKSLGGADACVMDMLIVWIEELYVRMPNDPELNALSVVCSVWAPFTVSVSVLPLAVALRVYVMSCCMFEAEPEPDSSVGMPFSILPMLYWCPQQPIPIQ